MNVEVKNGKRHINKSGFNPVEIQTMMDEILQEHNHICSNCCSTECQGKRSLDSEIIVRGIRTLNRDYIFECTGYKQKKAYSGYVDFDDMEYQSMFTGIATADYVPQEYAINNPKVKEYVRRLH